MNNIIKSIFFSLCFAFVLILYLNNKLNTHFWGIVFDSFWLTGLAVFYALFMMSSLGPRLNSRYFRIGKIESSTRIYALLGVKIFKRMIKRNPLPYPTRKFNLEGRKDSDILKLEKEMREAEEAHFWGFMLNIILALIFGFYRDSRFFVWLLIFNIPLNLYPIFLQRYNRNRINIMLNRYAETIKMPNIVSTRPETPVIF